MIRQTIEYLISEMEREWLCGIRKGERETCSPVWETGSRLKNYQSTSVAMEWGRLSTEAALPFSQSL